MRKLRQPFGNESLGESVEWSRTGILTIILTFIDTHTSLSSYPGALKTHQHHTKAYLPISIAKALAVSPELIQKAVEGFYVRDPSQLRVSLHLCWSSEAELPRRGHRLIPSIDCSEDDSIPAFPFNPDSHHIDTTRICTIIRPNISSTTNLRSRVACQGYQF